MMLLLAVCTFTTAWAQNYITGIYTNISGPATMSGWPLTYMFSTNQWDTRIEWGDISNQYIDIYFETSELIYPTAYKLTRGTTPGFAPHYWYIEGKRNSGDNWKVLSTEETDVFDTADSHDFSISSNKQGYYKYFHFRIFRYNNQEKLFLREFKFRGYKTYDLSQSEIYSVQSEYLYQGGDDIVPVPTVKHPDGTNPLVTLVEGLHYTTAIKDSNGQTVSAATAEGNYTVTVTGISPCSGSKSVGFTVVKPWQGDGTEQSPYIIANNADFDKLAEVVNNGESNAGKHFRLDADLTYNYAGLAEGESNFTPIAYSYFKYFSGIFNGNHKTISGIRICRDGSNEFVGIFGNNNGTIKDLTVTDTRIESDCIVGGIVGNNGGTISNCHVTATVTVCAHSYHLGGIAGDSHGTLSHSTSAATLVASSATTFEVCGGIAGDAGGTISNCISTATITAATGTAITKCGGIVGESIYGTIYDNFAIGVNIPTASDNTHGAIVGYRLDDDLQRNYYMDCTIGGVENATNVGAVGSDMDGARYALPFSYTDKLTRISGGGSTYNGQLYVGASETITFNGEEAPFGHVYKYPTTNGTVTLNDGTTYTLTIAADATSAVTVGFSDVDVWDVDNGADGSEEHPYIITTTDGLDYFASTMNVDEMKWPDTYFELDDDIHYTYNTAWNDLCSTENNYTAIGYNPNFPFLGHFDGKGHTISGIRIYNRLRYTTYQGIFGYVGDGGEVKNVTLADTRITSVINAGGIVGRNAGTITNCHVKSDVTIYCDYKWAWERGGIVGGNYGTGIVSYCTSAVNIPKPNTEAEYDSEIGIGNSDNFGGIAGRNLGTLSHNLAVGATIANLEYDGGHYGAIAGSNHGNKYTGYGTFDHNYYANCTVGDVENASNVGVYFHDGNEWTLLDLNTETMPDGAVPGFVLYDNGTDNATIISENNGQTKNVILFGRTLRKDGTWNALCLPFDVEVGSGQLEDATAMTFNASTSGFDSTKGKLSLYFDEVTEGNTIAAGTPFIVKWDTDTEGTKGTADTELRNPVFSGVTINDVNTDDVTSTDGKVSFLGNFSPVALTGGDRSNLCLGNENQLYWPSADGNLNAFRAYLHVDGMVQAIQGEPALALLGDVNTNGGIDIGDAVCIVNYLVNKLNTSFNPAVADLNGNGQIDIGDAVMIVNILVGKTNTPSAPLMTTEEGLQTTDYNEPQ